MSLKSSALSLVKSGLLLGGAVVGGVDTEARSERRGHSGSSAPPQSLAAQRPVEYIETADYRRRATCRICKALSITPFLDFGPMPLANNFRTPEENLADPEPRFPLSAVVCRNCGLVQVPDVVNPRILFSHYRYFSSASRPMVEHFQRQAASIQRQYLHSSADLICEIGSNDGIFLQNLVGRCRVIGVDPADNIAAVAAGKGVPTVNRFFNQITAASIRALFGPAQVVFAANCFAHIDDIDGVMEGVRTLLDEQGVFVFENHRFADMLRGGGFDQIYHEHLCYYTLRPLERLLGRYGMRIIEARTIPTHGESFQIHAAFASSRWPEQPSVQQVRDEEAAMGLDDVETCREFAAGVADLRDDLRGLLADLKRQGRRIVGYGAPGKGSTLLNYCGIGRETLDYIVDSTPIKQGKCMPGTGVLIQHPQTLHENPPDYLLLLAWNYADAILNNEQALRDRGVKFILPVPKLEIV